MVVFILILSCLATGFLTLSEVFAASPRSTSPATLTAFSTASTTKFVVVHPRTLIISSRGPAGRKLFSKMGEYLMSTDDTVNGRPVWKHSGGGNVFFCYDVNDYWVVSPDCSDVHAWLRSEKSGLEACSFPSSSATTSDPYHWMEIFKLWVARRSSAECSWQRIKTVLMMRP